MCIGFSDALFCYFFLLPLLDRATRKTSPNSITDSHTVKCGEATAFSVTPPRDSLWVPRIRNKQLYTKLHPIPNIAYSLTIRFQPR